MTHGEVWFAKARAKEVKIDGKGNCVAICGLPDRMGYREATAYYKKKFRDYFEQQLTVRDFDSVDDYFGYFEAQKIMKSLIRK